MSVRIRLRRMGAKKKPFYRVVVTDSRKPRGGRYIESLGHYDPMKEPSGIHIEEEKLFSWLKNGAQPSATVSNLLARCGLRRKWEMLKRGEDVSQLEMPPPKVRAPKKTAQPVAEEGQPEGAEAIKGQEKAVPEEPAAAEEVTAAKEEETLQVKESSEKTAPQEKPKKPAVEKAKKEAAPKAAKPKDQSKTAAKKAPARKRSSAKAGKKDSDKGDS